MRALVPVCARAWARARTAEVELREQRHRCKARRQRRCACCADVIACTDRAAYSVGTVTSGGLQWCVRPPVLPSQTVPVCACAVARVYRRGYVRMCMLRASGVCVCVVCVCARACVRCLPVALCVRCYLRAGAGADTIGLPSAQWCVERARVCVAASSRARVVSVAVCVFVNVCLCE
jgi:hypothetical protein